MDKVIPSLMFFIKEDKQKKRFSFLRRLLTDLVFLIQLLAILGLAFAMAEPFIKVNKNAETGNTVLIIDSSTSMQTKSGSSTRFEKAAAEAQKSMHGKVSIVLASLNPTIALENGIQTEARHTLNMIKPKDSSTNIKGAMDLADSLLEQTKGKVVVLSDFITTKDADDPLVSKRLLNSRGNAVDFVNLAEKVENIGFVDATIQKDITEAYIKNFNDQEKTVTISLLKEEKTVTKQDLTIAPRSKEKISFNTQPGLSTLKISPEDSLDSDNILYISSPVKDEIKVLIISNNIHESIKSALEASKYIKVDIAEPPIIPDLNYDAVIINDINKDELLPGTFNDIKRYLEKGGNLIITVQDGLSNLDMLDILPVYIIGEGNQSKIISATSSEVTKDIEFGITKRFLKTNIRDNSTLPLVISEDNSALVAYKPYSNGKVIYYGLFDDDLDFKFSPDYPIFWNNMVNFMISTEDINDYNSKIGEKSLVEKAGFVQEENKMVAYNFLDESESDVSKDPLLFSKEFGDFVAKEVKEKYDMPLAMTLLIIACLFLLFETWYIKYRGDL
jgi:hypothetical protein